MKETLDNVVDNDVQLVGNFYYTRYYYTVHAC